MKLCATKKPNPKELVDRKEQLAETQNTEQTRNNKQGTTNKEQQTTNNKKKSAQISEKLLNLIRFSSTTLTF